MFNSLIRNDVFALCADQGTDHKELLKLVNGRKKPEFLEFLNVRANGETMLTIAARAGSEKTVKLLLDAGANPSKPNDVSETAQSIAEEKNHKGILALLKMHEEKAQLAAVAGA